MCSQPSDTGRRKKKKIFFLLNLLWVLKRFMQHCFHFGLLSVSAFSSWGSSAQWLPALPRQSSSKFLTDQFHKLEHYGIYKISKPVKGKKCILQVNKKVVIVFCPIMAALLLSVPAVFPVRLLCLKWWLCLSRYYWLEDENLYQRAVNAQFPYAYEYLGNTGRLVITPLTDRCVLSLLVCQRPLISFLRDKNKDAHTLIGTDADYGLWFTN